MKTIRYIFLLVVLITILLRCAVNPVTGKKEFMLLSKDQEVAMGKEADPEIIAAYGLYPSNELQQFIENKGQAMAKISHRPELQYEFKILNTPVVNAFAVPGGYVYFTRGIMAHLNSEAEFAGVLGHEIGHVAARHSAKQYSRAMAAQLGIAVGSLVSKEFAQFSDIATTGAGLLFLKYGRDAERQSDKLGVEYSTKTGYDAHAMANFFTTLDRMSGSDQELPVFLSTHPDPGERRENVDDLADKWQKKDSRQQYIINRNNYLKRIDGIIYGEDPREGYVEGQVFYHPEMKFYYPVPSGWKVENTPQQVNMLSPSNDAIIILGLSQKQSLDDAASELVSQYNLEVSSTDRMQIHGLDAANMIASQSSQGQVLHLSIYLIHYNNLIFQFISATTPDNFSQLRPITDRTARGFNKLTDPSKINVRPHHIAIKEANTTTSLNRILTNLGVSENKLEEHALLNGFKLDQTIDKGMLLKIIE